MRGTAKAPGTCGELVQGIINSKNFLITCPINCYSEVTVCLNKNDYIFINDSKRNKVVNAVTKTMLLILNKICGASVYVNSQLPISKGMASSTADIAAACLATAKALNYELTPQDIAKIALSIEPSDGLFFPGIVAFDHISGEYYKFMGKALNIDIHIYDFGGEVDTIIFNQRPDLQDKNKLKEPLVKEAMEFIELGFKNNNPKLIGQGATISSLANQTILNKPELEEIIDLVTTKGALGVNIAHSGTLLGVLTERDNIDMEALSSAISKNFSKLNYLGNYRLVDGGVKYLEIKEDEMWDRSASMVAT